MWLDLTMTLSEEMAPASGEDDGLLSSGFVATREVTTAVTVRRSGVRYFLPRRDARVGCEVWFRNGHIIIVQNPESELVEKLPEFIMVHDSDLGCIYINPDAVRFFHAMPSGSGSGSIITFDNGHKRRVTDPYEKIYAAVNQED